MRKVAGDNVSVGNATREAPAHPGKRSPQTRPEAEQGETITPPQRLKALNNTLHKPQRTHAEAIVIWVPTVVTRG